MLLINFLQGEVYFGVWNQATNVALKKLKEGNIDQFINETKLLVCVTNNFIIFILIVI